MMTTAAGSVVSAARFPSVHRITAVSARAPTATVRHCGPSPHGSIVAVSSAAPTKRNAVVRYSPVGLAIPAAATKR
jgi:hypothetical protein